MESQGRKSMKQHDAPVRTLGRQMSLMFELCSVEGMHGAERWEAITALAQVLMQAARLVIEELDDERHLTDPYTTLEAQSRRLCASIVAVSGHDQPGKPATAI